jgi:hypothetical protein
MVTLNLNLLCLAQYPVARLLGLKAGAEEVIDEAEVAIAAGASAKAVEVSWTAAPDPLVPARASADASSSKEAELLLTLRLVAGVVTTGV